MCCEFRSETLDGQYEERVATSMASLPDQHPLHVQAERRQLCERSESGIGIA